MPSRRLQRHLLPRRKATGLESFRWIAAVSLLLPALLAACGSTGKAPVEPPVRRHLPQPLELDREDRPYLVSPLTGYPESSGPERGQEIEGAFRALVDEGDLGGAHAAATELLEADPAFHPAQVLAAQVEFAKGDDAAVIRRLVPVGDALPGYTASQLLLGRASERSGDLALAYAAYRAVAAHSQLAFQRTGELHPRALEILFKRLEDDLRRSDLDKAQENLRLLQDWAPSELVTLEAARSVAMARGDLPAELKAVKDLSSRRPDDRKLLERRAELELTVGDAGSGLEIIQGLAKRNPKDPELAEKLKAAKFLWRLKLLPQVVQQVAVKPELNRADFAVLLYWLVPNVRYGRPSAGRIATDVLDHPRQEEIVRVVNLGLMDVDATLHRFSPGGSMRRGSALRSLHQLLSQFGHGLQCLGGSSCDVAVRCGLVSAEEGCQASAPISGTAAVDLIRRSLDLLGAS